jgi:uncharacterized protein (DUF1501 family)
MLSRSGTLVPELVEMPIRRRSLLQAGLAGVTGFWLANRLGRSARAAEATSAKAKAVIQIWMWGGPPQNDTFDPKPGAGYDVCGPLGKTAQTNVPGTQIGELLPELAKMADKYSIIRSMTHGQNGHETAAYMTQTGHPAGGNLVYPSAGGIVSKFLGVDAGYEGLIPPYIVLTQPQGRFSEAGFLGSRYKPFATGGDPARPRFEVEGVVAEGISEERQRARRVLLGRLNSLAQSLQGDQRLETLQACETEAYDLILGDAGKVFDLSQEKTEVREKYGMTTFGQSCLVARRLIEKGVRYVTINYNGWDTHKENFQAMRRMLPQLDKGMSSLLQDLSDRGLLDSTIVWWGGEFGRTPKVDWEPPWNGGRGHHGAVFSSVVAGGGLRGGAVVGASDEIGAVVKDRPVYPWDLLGTMYQLLGIDPDGTVQHPHGMEVALLPKKEDGVEVGGRLTELV